MQPTLKSFETSRRPQKWTAAIDYFRWKVTSMAAVKPIRERLRELQYKDAQRASDIRRWSFEGYKGQASESVRWGERGGELIWESSGSQAASTVASMQPSSGFASRIDVALTFQFSQTLPGFGMSLLDYETRRQTTSHQKQTLFGVSTRTDGLWLGTVGRRTSHSYLRVYDKGIESKMAPRGILWRVELEAKQTHSRRLWADHSSSLNNPSFCASYVASSVRRLGLRWPYEALVPSSIDIRLGKKEETTAGKLAVWLATTVAPTLPRLLTVFSVAEVLEMLKLSDVAAPIAKDNAHVKRTQNDWDR